MKLVDFLTEECIQVMCNSRTYQRGLNYFKQGKVLEYEHDPTDDILYSKVDGSMGYVYEQEILVDSYMELEGTCTCPVGYNCKHVVAASLKFLHDLCSDDAESGQRYSPLNKADALSRWKGEVLDALGIGEAKQNTLSLHNDFQLLFVLVHEHEKLVCKLVRSKRLKRGTWGKCTPCGVQHLLAWYSRPHWVHNEDVDIISLLQLNPDLKTELEPKGDVGFLALSKMVESGRCFFAEPSETPLEFAPARPLTLEWEEIDSGLLELRWAVDGCENAHLIPTDPFCYLDVERHCCGELQASLPASQLQLLSQLPPVTQERAQELSVFLLQNFAHRGIPLPAQVSIKDAKPGCVPCLSLRRCKTLHNSMVYIARLCFGYPPLSFEPEIFMPQHETQVVEHAGDYWRVVRDVAAEQRALERLADFGFQPAETIGVADSNMFDLALPAKDLPASVSRWKNFLDQVPVLEAEGWKVELESSFQLQFVKPEDLALEVRESSVGWFDVGLEISFEGEKIALLPLIIQYLKQGETTAALLLELEEGRWLECPRSLVQPVIETLVELHDSPGLGAFGALALPTARIHALPALEESMGYEDISVQWRGGKELKALAERLRQFGGIESVPPPEGLVATLRDYQLKGLSWLQFLRDYAFGGILADDMGLGKTVQTLAHIVVEKEAGRLDNPVLVVAPTSVLSTWRKEAEHFTPSLQVLVWHGPQRSKQHALLEKQDLIITSYPLLQRDVKLFQTFDFHLLILDEAQMIKNPSTKMAQAACAQQARHRLCLSGTPVENHLGELWSLFHFLMPGYLGTQTEFTRLFRNPIEKTGNVERRRELERRIRPFVLRRDKQQVATELPPKTTIVSRVEFDTNQTRLYESVRSAMLHKVSELLEQKGLKKSRIEILDALLKLRQVCCDPHLVKLESAQKCKYSAKMERLLEMLETLLSEGRKILIFSQFTSMLSLIEAELKMRDIAYTKLTGRTRNRDVVTELFQSGKVPVFLISLKAGGVGLNLTAADTVIHYDPWWNPAVENQATDRAYRIGQDKPVFVFKLVAQGTIEEKILELQEKKRQLADMVYRQGDSVDDVEVFSGEELVALLEH